MTGQPEPANRQLPLRKHSVTPSIWMILSMPCCWWRRNGALAGRVAELFAFSRGPIETCGLPPTHQRCKKQVPFDSAEVRFAPDERGWFRFVLSHHCDRMQEAGSSIQLRFAQNDSKDGARGFVADSVRRFADFLRLSMHGGQDERVWLSVVASHPCDRKKSQGWGTGLLRRIR